MKKQIQLRNVHKFKKTKNLKIQQTKLNQIKASKFVFPEGKMMKASLCKEYKGILFL